MFEVGQKLWFVPSSRHSTPCEVTVTKVGRVWAYLDDKNRCNAAGVVEGGDFAPRGTCYADREAYETKQARRKAWDTFTRALERKEMPESLTLEELAKISKALGL